LTSGSGLTVEVWLSTDHPHQTGPARIVSYSIDTGARNFTIGQDGRNMQVRLRTTETNLNGIPALTVGGVFGRRTRRHIVVTYDFRDLCVYVDGERAACRSSPAGGFEDWDPEHILMFGNERTADRPWLGALFLVALYDRALLATEIATAYRAAFSSALSGPATESGLVGLWLFAEGSGNVIHDTSTIAPVNLTIPSIVDEPRCGFLSPGRRLSPIDVIANVLIFVPFGFLCYVSMRGRSSTAVTVIATVTITAIFTVAIESLQYCLVSRCSQRDDVVLNVLGGLIGALASIRRVTIRQ
jgi:hypothetical protein